MPSGKKQEEEEKSKTPSWGKPRVHNLVLVDRINKQVPKVAALMHGALGSSLPYLIVGGYCLRLNGYPVLNCDVDIILRRSDLSRATELLVEHQFSQQDTTLPLFQRSDANHRNKVMFSHKDFPQTMLDVYPVDDEEPLDPDPTFPNLKVAQPRYFVENQFKAVQADYYHRFHYGSNAQNMVELKEELMKDDDLIFKYPALTICCRPDSKQAQELLDKVTFEPDDFNFDDDDSNEVDENEEDFRTQLERMRWAFALFP
ncbi:hypothetical protein QOT17_010753 [Balamuthia mandrillaris]